MITYPTFYRLHLDASEFTNLDAFTAECGGSVPEDNERLMFKALELIWKLRGDWNPRTIRSLTGLSQQEFCRTCRIPLSSYNKWESGASSAPEYVLAYLAYAVFTAVLDPDAI